jgi:hypothetical protein
MSAFIAPPIRTRLLALANREFRGMSDKEGRACAAKVQSNAIEPRQGRRRLGS